MGTQERENAREELRGTAIAGYHYSLPFKEGSEQDETHCTMFRGKIQGGTGLTGHSFRPPAMMPLM